MSNLSSVIEPLNTAKGLPNEHYIDDKIFQEEKESVLFSNWSAIGFAKDTPKVGDVNPTTFLGMPLLVVRDNDKKVRVYQNTCRHRGMVLISERRNIRGTIRCPYHSWCYGLDGQLRSTPHVGGPGQNTHPDIKRNELGLVEIRSHVFMDVVFVNISNNAASFEEVHSDIINQWQEFDKPLYHNEDSSFELTVKSNWKLAVENYCESYHLPWVHPGLNLVSRLEDHYHIENTLKYSGQGSYVYSQLKGKDNEVFPDFDGLKKKWNTASEYISLYPNVLLGVHRDHTYAIILEPISTNKTREHVAIYYASAEATKARFKDLRIKNKFFWEDVFKEDIFVVEGMQEGRNGKFFDGGKFSPAMDGPTHLFHEWVATQINLGRKEL
ncbi:aromatic ring-hydroxylating dioxygenase subunit alpha [Amylibacter sp.]|jgi:choline monooxygenase|nr:aromatic ring-hydroxylating dioxygenase subunit alpha [Amylibacter sp.]